MTIFFGQSPPTCHFPPMHPFLGTGRVDEDLKMGGGCGIAQFCDVRSQWIVCICVGSTGQVHCHCHNITDVWFHHRDAHTSLGCWTTYHHLLVKNLSFFKKTIVSFFQSKSETCYSTKTCSVTMSTQWGKEWYILSFLAVFLKNLGLQGKALSMYFRVFGSRIAWNYFLWLVT
jgi:hypothetical protein